MVIYPGGGHLNFEVPITGDMNLNLFYILKLEIEIVKYSGLHQVIGTERNRYIAILSFNWCDVENI